MEVVCDKSEVEIDLFALWDLSLKVGTGSSFDIWLLSKKTLYLYNVTIKITKGTLNKTQTN